ncbi:MAG: hydroxymethylglutaryl-CoA reductase, degradative [Candidatus Binatia bacterium]|nr:hydroxymethylglutaryl-CoA reductase, degradative [Candidatus Binatia bacterium]MDG2010733.1 hydroxymethylglutaryl-CoA reductase, degradative [Candidatus Binatia bacterium]HAC81323.1 hydroxymethylglutaryl-CoA reductase, degradative [Deltaproteobacteria bacterium]
MKHKQESRISGFHRLSIADRQEELARRWDLNPEEMADLRNEAPLALSRAAQLTENTVGIYALPMGVALNFRVDGEDRLVPMVTEEPSVIAAASNAARLALDGGGFRAESDPSSMIAQIQLVDVPDPEQAKASIEAASGTLMARIDALAPGMARRGGGARSIDVRILPAPMEHTFVVVHLHIDVGDAMGANAINTIAEELAPEIAALSGGRAHLRILSNLPDRRVSRAEALYTFAALEMPDRSGAEVARAIELASLFAEADPYRAATHNKGIMNGIDAVAIATGNDWRALEASAHAFAAQKGSYTALSTWRVTEQGLRGRIEIPIAVGVVGATVDGNPRARLALKLLGCEKATELASVMAAVGLAQNFGALRALATEGIQKGHMARHARAVASGAGVPDDRVEEIAELLIQKGEIKIEAARRLLAEDAKA